jgi:hypothetical protein
LALFFISASLGFLAASAKAFTCSKASSLSSPLKFGSALISASSWVSNSLIPGLSGSEDEGNSLIMAETSPPT